mgnify:CR=1 FL=1
MLLNHKIQGEGPALVVLHGLFGSLDNWQTLANQFASSGFKVITADLRNHGRSPHSDEFNFDVMADDLLELIDSLGLEKPILAGHSLGGKVVMKFSIKYPEKSRALTVVDIAPRYYPVHHREIIAGLRAIPVPGIGSRSEADEILSSHIHSSSVRQFLLKNLSREGDGFSWKMNLEVIEKEIENVGEAIMVSSQVEQPALFLKGGKSDYITFDDEKEIFNMFSKVDVKTCPEAGHWIHAETPDCLMDHMLKFYNGL